MQTIHEANQSQTLILPAARWGALGLSAGALIMGYTLQGWWQIGLALAGVTALWILSLRLHWPWIPPVAFIAFAIAAGGGTWLNVPPAWLAAGLAAALSAWDLESFSRRLGSVQRVENRARFVRQHLFRLAAVDGLGLLLVGAAWLVEVQFNFGVALVLVLLAILGLNRGIGYLRRAGS